MHALGRFIQDLMDKQGMSRVELARTSGLSKQHISQMLDDSKTRLGRMVDDKTIRGLLRAFPDISEPAFVTKAAEALGVPVDRLPQVDPDYERLSNDALLGILRKRLTERSPGWPAAGGSEETTSPDTGATNPTGIRETPVDARRVGKADQRQASTSRPPTPPAAPG